MPKETDKDRELKAIYMLKQLGYSVIAEDRYRCNSCSRELSLKTNFYESNSPIYRGCNVSYEVHRNGEYVRVNSTILPICKHCIEKMYKDHLINTKNNEKLAMYKLSQDLRIPWNESLWVMASESKTDTYKIYIGKGNSLPQYSSLTMADSEEYQGDVNSTFEEEAKIAQISMRKRDKREAVERWGNTWNEYQLNRLEEFYHNMKASNKIETPQDDDYLKKLARLSVKIDDAIDNDESAKAKQLGDLYSKYMSDSKFRATDMSGKDETGGARTISQIAEEVESDDFIPPWEKYAYKLKVEQDIVDKTIMHIQNFVLRFKDRNIMSEPPLDTPKVGEEDEL